MVDEVVIYLEDGIVIVGNIFLYEFFLVWNWFDVWNGMVVYCDGFIKFLIGYYLFLVCVFCICGNRDEEDDWVVLRVVFFWLEYI